MPTTFTRSLAALALASTLALSTTTASAHEGHNVEDARPAKLTSSERREIREATKRFKDVDAARAAGYVPAGPCVELPGVGGMGFHYAKPSLADDVIDPSQPELLLYEQDERGRLRLVGVEYFKADADQDLRTDDDRPNLFGHPFEGPMPGHEPGGPVHFDLHVWLYEPNPAGQLATWNPRVSCP